MRKKHLKDMKIRTRGELYNMRRSTFDKYNKAVREGRKTEGGYYQGMADIIRWVLNED